MSFTWVDGAGGGTPLNAANLNALEQRVENASGHVLVTHYGATGDGSTDDAAEIQAAIDAAEAAGGGTVIFPPGTYLVGSAITLRSKVHLRGVGPSATVLKLAASSNTDLFVGEDFATLTGTASTGGIYHWSIEGMTLDGNAPNNPTAGTGIKVYGYDFRLHDLRIKSFRRNGIYTEWHVNATPTTGFSMEAVVADVNVTGCGDEGIVWAGPHDSHWHAVVVWSCNLNGTVGRGVHVKSTGNALNAVQCHVWGGQHAIGWYLEGPTSLTDCQGEGATTAQVVLASGDCRIIGGHYFAAGAASTKGIMIGDATHTGIVGSMIDTKISSCTAGAVDFTGSGGTEIVRALVYQTSGSARVGPISFAGTLLQLHVIGGATGALTILPGSVAFRNGGTSGSSWADGSTTRFNVDVNNKQFQGVNGGGFRAYSGNFSGQTWDVDGATGTMTLASGAILRTGAGSPEGVVAASPGSLFLRTDGGASTTFYVKTSGTGTSGWTAK